MRERQEDQGPKSDQEFIEHIGLEAARKRHARNSANESLWHDLGTIGTVGWTVGLPTLLGVLLGTWIDTVWENSPVSWTLVLLIVGLLLGIGSAWMWIAGEQKQIENQGFQKTKDVSDDAE